MSFKDLIEPECGGANPLMRLGQQVARDSALRDEAGISRRPDFLPAPEVGFNGSFNLFSTYL